MADSSPGVSQQAAEINLQNIKTLLDRFVGLMAQGAEDNQEDSRAWSALKLRHANNAATIDHMVDAGLVAAQATAATENQQTVSPAGTAASETAKGAVADAGAGIATANQAIADSLAAFQTAILGAVADLKAALVAPIVTSVGGASTPSQTKPPTTTA